MSTYLLAILLLLSCQNNSTIDKTEEEKIVSPIVLATTSNIEGIVSYPEKVIPRDLTVVVVEVHTGKVYSQRNWDRTTMRYKIEVVAPGDYQIYALTNSRKGYKAWYSEYVRCGMKEGCNSHQAITVHVDAGKNYDSVNPQDWYRLVGNSK